MFPLVVGCISCCECVVQDHLDLVAVMKQMSMKSGHFDDSVTMFEL